MISVMNKLELVVINLDTNQMRDSYLDVMITELIIVESDI